MSRLRKSVVPFRWSSISIQFTQGTPGSPVNLATLLQNPQNRVISYSVVGTLPAGVTLVGSSVEYNGSGAVGSASVQFRATSGGFTADSAATSVVIASAPVGNQPPAWTGPNPLDMGSFAAGTTTIQLPLATDPEGQPIRYYRTGSASDTLQGASLNDQTNLLTLPNGFSGAWQVEVDAQEFVAAGGITDLNQIIPQQTYAKPAVGASIPVPEYGTTLARVTDAAALGLTGIINGYSQQQAWNSTETLLLLYEVTGTQDAGNLNSTPAVFDAAAPFARRISSATLTVSGAQSSTWKWSPRSDEPRSLYVFAVGANPASLTWGAIPQTSGPILVRLNFDTNFAIQSRTVVAAWPTYTSIANAQSAEEAWIDGSNNVWVAGLLTSGGTQTAFAHNVTANQTYTVTLPSNSVDYVAMTPSCDGLIVAWASEYGGRYTGKELFTIGNPCVFVRQVDPTSDHGDWVKDSAGNQWMVYTNDNVGRYTRASVATGAQVEIAPKPSGGAGQHVSGQHRTGRDFVIVNSFSMAGGTWTAMRDEVVKVSLSSTIPPPSIVRLLQHRGAGINYIMDQPHATVNRSGTKALFKSNWGIDNGVVDVFMVDVP